MSRNGSHVKEKKTRTADEADVAAAIIEKESGSSRDGPPLLWTRILRDLPDTVQNERWRGGIHAIEKARAPVAQRWPSQ